MLPIKLISKKVETGTKRSSKKNPTQMSGIFYFCEKIKIENI